MIEYAFVDAKKYIVITTILCLVFVPLGIWKAIELFMWFFNHISISIY